MKGAHDHQAARSSRDCGRNGALVHGAGGAGVRGRRRSRALRHGTRRRVQPRRERGRLAPAQPQGGRDRFARPARPLRRRTRREVGCGDDERARRSDPGAARRHRVRLPAPHAGLQPALAGLGQPRRGERVRLRPQREDPRHRGGRAGHDLPVDLGDLRRRCAASRRGQARTSGHHHADERGARPRELGVHAARHLHAHRQRRGRLGRRLEAGHLEHCRVHLRRRAASAAGDDLGCGGRPQGRRHGRPQGRPGAHRRELRRLHVGEATGRRRLDDDQRCDRADAQRQGCEG